MRIMSYEILTPGVPGSTGVSTDSRFDPDPVLPDDDHCDYCGTVAVDSRTHCPSCGAPYRPTVYITANDMRGR